jgi:abequosyltransferase
MNSINTPNSDDKQSIRLSICIPTYNRALYLRETLNCIIGQCDESIEIIVSDNGSEDNTSEVVAEAKKKFRNITYHQWSENQGADRNYLKTVELAKGDYCWFFGSDDAIKEGAIDRIKAEINTNCDIYLCSEYLCDLQLKPYAIHYLLPENIKDAKFNLSDPKQLLDYFNLAQSHSALFGYLSCIIFKREKWNSIIYNEDYTGTLYSHMFMLYSFIDKGCILQYIREPLVYWRSGNDSFGGTGNIQKRYLIDIDGFTKIKNMFFVNDIEIANAFKGAFRRHHPYKNLAYLRLNTGKKQDWYSIEDKLVYDFGYNRMILSAMRNEASKFGLRLLFFAYRVQMKITRMIIKIN